MKPQTITIATFGRAGTVSRWRRADLDLQQAGDAYQNAKMTRDPAAIADAATRLANAARAERLALNQLTGGTI